jgi:uncharacterized membrane protein
MGFIVLILFYFLFPFLINYFCFRFSFARRIGAILIAYIFGLILGNIGIFPHAGEFMHHLIAEGAKPDDATLNEYLLAGSITEMDIQFYKLRNLQDLVTTITIPIALPLLLFSLNVRTWFKMAGKTFLSLLLGLLSVIIPIIAGYYMFQDKIEETWKIAGMMTGVYSGGTPNLAAIKTILDVPSETYVLTHTYDLILGAIFLVFVMSIGQRVLLKFLPAYKSEGTHSSEENFDFQLDKSFFEILKKETSIPLLKALGIAVLIFAIGGALSLLVPAKAQMLVAILTITTLGIAASLLPSINRIKKTFNVGMYFILVFSLVVASMADIRNFSSSHIHIFYWVTMVYVGSLIIHVLLSKIFNIDADNVIIVSTALTCSPPFVPVVAGALKNREIILAGLTVGIIGYAVGNYLGVFMAYLLKAIPL